MNEGKSSASESWEQNTSKKVGIKACASFIRARLLLQLTQLQQSSFALESNIKSQKEIDDKVARLGFNENSLLLMTKSIMTPLCFTFGSIDAMCLGFLQKKAEIIL
ncbi:hypothetical protein llap_4145 [Limosa lapponica baueri]|uniref:Uncharacterized protein n=1 Tax=Limosa lapponica baueri TaxID=1758121 RepID=A0A2I0UHQ3_LIMLA|nr:hypothetical protein llap_4145 [Limosa lapponica baueri]